MTPTMKATLKWVHKVSAGPSAVSFAMGGFSLKLRNGNVRPMTMSVARGHCNRRIQYSRMLKARTKATPITEKQMISRFLSSSR